MDVTWQQVIRLIYLFHLNLFYLFIYNTATVYSVFAYG